MLYILERGNNMFARVDGKLMQGQRSKQDFFISAAYVVPLLPFWNRMALL